MVATMAQSSGPQAFLCVRIQNRATMLNTLNGSGIKTARAISFDVAAPILSRLFTDLRRLKRTCFVVRRSRWWVGGRRVEEAGKEGITTQKNYRGMRPPIKEGRAVNGKVGNMYYGSRGSGEGQIRH